VRESDYEASFAQHSSVSEKKSVAFTDNQPSDVDHGTETYHEEPQLAASDEDSDSDDANMSSRHRDRFRTERSASGSAAAQLTAASKSEKRDIPDTLGKSAWGSLVDLYLNICFCEA